MMDGSLSTNAKNVKIIASRRHHKLRGPVDNQREKDTIATSAGKIAGKDKGLKSRLPISDEGTLNSNQKQKDTQI
jgi:hypothetical protein